MAEASSDITNRQSPSLLVSGSGSRPHYTRLTKMAMVKLPQSLGNILMRYQRVPFENESLWSMLKSEILKGFESCG